MKRLISLVLALALLLAMGTLPAVADDERVSGAYTYRVKGNGTAVITGYDWSSKDIYIPRMVDGYTVTEIGEKAFNEGKRINTLVIPDTVISIGAFAFAFLPIDTINITIPSSVQHIGPGAFACMSGLEQFTVASGNTVYTTIGGVLFDKVKKELVAFPLEKGDNSGYTIPDGIVSIGDFAFAHARLGKNFTIPETVESIGAYAFLYAEFSTIVSMKDPLFGNLRQETLLLPKSIKSIGPYSFFHASGLNGSSWKYILLDKTQLVEIPEGAFQASAGVDESIQFPASLKYIGNNAFYNVPMLGDLDLSSASNLLEIGDNAFSCEKHIARRKTKLKLTGTKLQKIGESAFQKANIVQVSLPDTLTSIGSHAFSKNNRLLQITLPASVSEIGEDFCDRAKVKLTTTPGTYAAVWASENGYIVEGGSEDTSWLTNP